MLFFLGALLLRRLRVLRAIVSVCNNERGQCDVYIKGLDRFVGLCMVLLSGSFAATAATECIRDVYEYVCQDPSNQSPPACHGIIRWPSGDRRHSCFDTVGDLHSPPASG